MAEPVGAPIHGQLLPLQDDPMPTQGDSSLMQGDPLLMEESKDPQPFYGQMPDPQIG